MKKGSGTIPVIGMVAAVIVAGAVVAVFSKDRVEEGEERLNNVNSQLSGFERDVELSSNNFLAWKQLRATTYIVTLRSVDCGALYSALTGTDIGGNTRPEEVSLSESPHAQVMLWAVTFEEEDIRKVKCRGQEYLGGTKVGQFLDGIRSSFNCAQRQKLSNCVNIGGGLRKDILIGTADAVVNVDEIENDFLRAGASVAFYPVWAGAEVFGYELPDWDVSSCPWCTDKGSSQPGRFGNVRFTYPEDAQPLVISPGSDGPDSNPPGSPDTNHFLQPPYAGKWENHGYSQDDLGINITGIPQFGSTSGSSDQFCDWNAFSGGFEPFWKETYNPSNEITFAPDPEIAAATMKPSKVAIEIEQSISTPHRENCDDLLDCYAEAWANAGNYLANWINETLEAFGGAINWFVGGLTDAGCFLIGGCPDVPDCWNGYQNNKNLFDLGVLSDEMQGRTQQYGDLTETWIEFNDLVSNTQVPDDSDGNEEEVQEISQDVLRKVHDLSEFGLGNEKEYKSWTTSGSSKVSAEAENVFSYPVDPFDVATKNVPMIAKKPIYLEVKSFPYPGGNEFDNWGKKGAWKKWVDKTTFKPGGVDEWDEGSVEAWKKLRFRNAEQGDVDRITLMKDAKYAGIAPASGLDLPDGISSSTLHVDPNIMEEYGVANIERFKQSDYYLEEEIKPNNDLVQPHRAYDFVICPGVSGKVQSNVGNPLNGDKAKNEARFKQINQGIDTRNMAFPYIELFGSFRKVSCLRPHEANYVDESFGEFSDIDAGWVRLVNLRDEDGDDTINEPISQDLDPNNFNCDAWSHLRESLTKISYNGGYSGIVVHKCGLEKMWIGQPAASERPYWKYTRSARRISVPSDSNGVSKMEETMEGSSTETKRLGIPDEYGVKVDGSQLKVSNIHQKIDSSPATIDITEEYSTAGCEGQNSNVVPGGTLYRVNTSSNTLTCLIPDADERSQSSQQVLNKIVEPVESEIENLDDNYDTAGQLRDDLNTINDQIDVGNAIVNTCESTVDLGFDTKQVETLCFEITGENVFDMQRHNLSTNINVGQSKSEWIGNYSINSCTSIAGNQVLNGTENFEAEVTGDYDGLDPETFMYEVDITCS
jgi:hypothetical protein